MIETARDAYFSIDVPDPPSTIVDELIGIR